MGFATQVLFIGATLPAILILAWTMFRDRLPEPPKVVFVTFLLSALATVPILIVNVLLVFVLGFPEHPTTIPEALLISFVSAALVEECVKYAVLRLLSLGVDRRDGTTPAPSRATNAAEAFASLEAGMTSERLRQLVRSVFVVERSSSAPGDAAFSVLHDGQWYYIRNDDRTTKQAFALLRDLFDLQVKPESANGRPVLTVPIR